MILSKESTVFNMTFVTSSGNLLPRRKARVRVRALGLNTCPPASYPTSSYWGACISWDYLKVIYN
jgi:hypothetical protein